jgi:hypothetical protein
MIYVAAEAATHKAANKGENLLLEEQSAAADVARGLVMSELRR